MIHLNRSSPTSDAEISVRVEQTLPQRGGDEHVPDQRALIA
jgi:hypothetical protein